MRTPYCCDSTRDLYENYYARQTGKGLPAFVGYRGQRGHGLGSVLGRLFRFAMPMLKKGLAYVGKHAAQTGQEIAEDVLAGQKFKESARRRLSTGIKRAARLGDFISQSGSGRKRKRKSSGKKKVTKKRKVKKDIFT